MPMSTYRSALGNGLVHDLFHASTRDEDILVISNSLCLTHLGRAMRDDVRDQPLFLSLLQIYKNVEGGISYFPKREQAGVFLITRITCRAALTNCSKWYSEVVGYDIGILVARRLADAMVLRSRRAHGCECERCNVSWLQDGWQCPTLRFRMFLHVNRALVERIRGASRPASAWASAPAP